ncbi:TIGR04222 domain-containing protein [Thermomonospora echinospora]|uniref:TIGR04222 domain-containing protein n=1 Tax=Thermomonospora echinospora TaxID=1992 RepID=A0A1H5SAW2_9ACTN|nr:TIGR04222 domain-containing membrane protein [Thermomonospora echinospora]SEF47128.1 TIGR04222 domain-containing protein [Thermomonospora echinospora]
MDALAVDVFAGTGDTWGISGPDFLLIYVAAAIVLLGAALAARRWACRGRPPQGDLDAYELAYLVGGMRRAVAASVAALRAEGAINVARKGKLRDVREPQTSRTELDQAVFAEVRHLDRPGVRQIGNMSKVRAAADRIRDGLVAKGLLAGPAERAQARLATVPLLILLAIGVVRLVAGLQNHRPVWFLVIAMGVVAVVTAVLWLRQPGLLRAGTAALDAARARNAHLNPTVRPAWTTYGAEGAAFGVALFGAAALTGIDPLFAEEAELAKQLAAGSGGGSSSSGASCAGASSCGGGGGCGGGGCGGGCGG